MVVDEGQAVACHMARGDVEGARMKIWAALVVILVLVIGLYVMVIAAVMWIARASQVEVGRSEAARGGVAARETRAAEQSVSGARDARGRTRLSRIFTAGGGECFHVDSRRDGLQRAIVVLERRPYRVCCI